MNLVYVVIVAVFRIIMLCSMATMIAARGTSPDPLADFVGEEKG